MRNGDGFRQQHTQKSERDSLFPDPEPGLLGWLPVVANLEYTLAVFRFKENPRALKIAFLINMLMYTVFNAIILNIVGAVSSLIVATTTTVFLIKDKKNNSKPGETPEPSEQPSSLDDLKSF